MKKKKRNTKKCAGSGTKKDWTVGDFVNSVWNTMEEQTKDNESLKMLHARLSPEWNRVTQKVEELLSANSQEAVTEKIEEICKFGERAVRPLIDIVIRLNKRNS